MKYLPVKLYFTREKKPNECPWKKKWGRVKTEKSVRENNVLYLKTPKSQKKLVSRALLSFTGKKNTDHKRCRWATDRLQQHTLVTDQTDLGHQGL